MVPRLFLGSPALIASVCGVAACGDLMTPDDATTLFEIKGQLSAQPGLALGENIRVGLIWAAMEPYHGAETRTFVAPQTVEIASYEFPSSFTLALRDIPPDEVMAVEGANDGPPVRMTSGSLVVFEDLDGDGVLTFPTLSTSVPADRLLYLSDGVDVVYVEGAPPTPRAPLTLDELRAETHFDPSGRMSLFQFIGQNLYPGIFLPDRGWDVGSGSVDRLEPGFNLVAEHALHARLHRATYEQAHCYLDARTSTQSEACSRLWTPPPQPYSGCGLLGRRGFGLDVLDPTDSYVCVPVAEGEFADAGCPPGERFEWSEEPVDLAQTEAFTRRFVQRESECEPVWHEVYSTPMYRRLPNDSVLQLPLSDVSGRASTLCQYTEADSETRAIVHPVDQDYVVCSEDGRSFSIEREPDVFAPPCYYHPMNRWGWAIPELPSACEDPDMMCAPIDLEGWPCAVAD